MGNTVYSTEVLNNVLGIYPGDVYNQKLLDKRTREDDDAVSNIYLNNGYLFFTLVPIEAGFMFSGLKWPEAMISRMERIRSSREKS